MTLALDLYGGDGVFRFLDLGFGLGVRGLELKWLPRSVGSKYAMFGFAARL